MCEQTRLHSEEGAVYADKNKNSSDPRSPREILERVIDRSDRMDTLTMANPAVTK